jgi:hypothetical protein
LPAASRTLAHGGSSQNSKITLPPRRRTRRMYSKSLVSQFGKVVAIVVRRGILRPVPVGHLPVQHGAGGILAMQQQVVLRENAPPLPGALRAQFGEGGRRGGAAPAEHLLEPRGVIDVHRRRCHGRRQQPAAHRSIPAGEGQLVPVHIQRRVGGERLFPVQQNAHRQSVVGHNGDGPQVSAILDAGLFPEALRMAARARLHGRHLAQPRRVVIADRQARLAAADFHGEASAGAREDPAQLRLFAAPGVDLDGPLKQRGQPFGEVLSRRAQGTSTWSAATVRREIRN